MNMANHALERSTGDSTHRQLPNVTLGQDSDEQPEPTVQWKLA
jgi:hypothetical protein